MHLTVNRREFSIHAKAMRVHVFITFYQDKIDSILHRQKRIMKRNRIIGFLLLLKNAIVVSLFIQTGINLYFFSFRDLFNRL
jgi:hypothetical protein